MDEKQLNLLKSELKDHLSETVKNVVNGKIDAINLKLTNYIHDDETWKVRAEPVVKAFENTSWLWRAFLGTLKFLGLLSVGIGAWKVLSDLFHK